MKSLEQLVRPNIWSLSPYRCARNEYEGKDARAFLDANENPFNRPLNRYPDPLQRDLKEVIAQIKDVDPQNIFLGNGSDEAIDLCYRIFCIPGKGGSSQTGHETDCRALFSGRNKSAVLLFQ